MWPSRACVIKSRLWFLPIEFSSSELSEFDISKSESDMISWPFDDDGFSRHETICFHIEPRLRSIHTALIPWGPRAYVVTNDEERTEFTESDRGVERRFCTARSWSAACERDVFRVFRCRWWALEYSGIWLAIAYTAARWTSSIGGWNCSCRAEGIVTLTTK